MDDERARSIESIEDVEALLGADRVSFEEYLKAIHVAKPAGRWDLVDQCATRAIGQTKVRRMADRSVVEAARAFISVRFSRVETVAELRDSIIAAADDLDRLGGNISALDQTRQLVREVHVLLSDDTAASYISACARLRRLDQARVGAIAATQVVGDDRYDSADQARALTTRGAARLDQGLLQEGTQDLERAWDMVPSAYSATALARAHLKADAPPVAMDWAEKAIEMSPSRHAYAALAAAAKAAGDEYEYERALAGIDEHTDSDAGLSQRWPIFIAGKALVSAGRLDEAAEVADQLFKDGERGHAKQLRWQIRSARQPELPL